jgi:pimeloyl-ACP methyl ester carboxylesterase
MFLRGRSTDNPVLLFLHGGPGMPEYFLAEKKNAALEEKFTICYWEQRGAGLSYEDGMSGAGITVDRLVDDTIEVSRSLCERFGQQKIYLMAHSWGTFLASRRLRKPPNCTTRTSAWPRSRIRRHRSASPTPGCWRCSKPRAIKG